MMTLEAAFELFTELIGDGFQVTVSGGPPAHHPSAPKDTPRVPWCCLEVRGPSLEYTKEDLMKINERAKAHGADWTVKIGEGVSIR